jgi:hypothetical protein
MSQGLNFDKFMDDILIREAEEAARKRKLEEESNTPQREYIRRYAEKPHNRMKVGGK